MKHTSYRRSLITRGLARALAATLPSRGPRSLARPKARFDSSLARPRVRFDPRASALVLALSALLQLTVGSARAQELVEPAAYRGVVREALSEYTAKNFPEARALFAEAHRLYPNARTLRGLGMTAFELRSYRESIAYLNEALASQVKPLDGSLRAETERLLARAERFVGKLNLEVNPASAEVLLDGNPIHVSAGTPLVLEVGEHSLEFRAEGYATETRSLYVKGHEVETWTVVLNKQPPQAAAPIAPAPAEVAARADQQPEPGPRYFKTGGNEDRPSKQPVYKSPWLWTGVGVAVVAIVVTSVVVATRDNEVARADINRTNTPDRGVFIALEGTP